MRTMMWTGWALALLFLATTTGIGIGCSGGGTKTPVLDGATATDTGADSAAEGRTCQDIRACIASGCGDNEQACIDRCIGMGSAAGKALFQVLATCTAAQCPTGTSSCACEQQCYADGVCLTETDACVGAPTDLVCDTFCH